MRFIIHSIFCVALACPVTANKVLRLDLTLKNNGEIISSPSILTHLNQASKLETVSNTGDGTYIETKTSQGNGDEIIVELTIGKITSGKKEILFTPKFHALMGKKAEMTFKSTHTKENYSISVIPTI